MIQYNLIKQLVNNVRIKGNNISVLQIGPSKNTYEIELRAIKNNKCSVDGSNEILKDCAQCPYRCICRAGLPLEKGNLCYTKCCFDKIMLLANSGINEQETIEGVIPFLKPNGHLTIFAHFTNSLRQEDISYAIKDIFPQITKSGLDIISVQNIIINKEPVLCITTTAIKVRKKSKI